MVINKKKTIIASYIGIYFLIPFFSSLFALIFMGYTSPQFLPVENWPFFDTITDAEDFWLIFFQWGAFPIVIGILTYIGRPISIVLFSRSVSPESMERAKIKVINSPFTISLLSLLGWELSSILTFIRILQLYPTAAEQGLYVTMTVSTFWGFFVFAFSFFSVDYLNRLYLIPCFFPKGGLGKYANRARFSILTKHLIVWTSIVVFPMMLLLLGLIKRSNLRINDIFQILQNDVLFQLALVLLTLSFVITYIVANSMHVPLRKMEEATSRIAKQDFNTRVLIHSSDELGVLGDAINDMARELAEKERIKDTFGRIVDPRIRDYLMSNEHNLGGKTVNATILFSDLRDFTKLSENRTPIEVLFILNRYFQAMSNAVEAHGGFINKFIGDAILAVFGTPLPLESPVLTAIETARSMSENLKHLNLEFEKENLPILKMGIGIHTGSVLAGNIGSLSRMEFTVIGDTVNTASRVEGLCKGLALELLITEACYQALPEEKRKRFQFIGEFELKGRLTKERIFG